ITYAIVGALDPDRHIEKACVDNGLDASQDPSDEQVATAQKALLQEAVKPLPTMPDLRQVLVELKQSFEQLIDEVSIDELTEAGFSEEAKLKAKTTVQSFEEFLAENKDEIEALKFFYAQPYQERLRYQDIKALHERLAAPPRNWTEQRL